MTQIRLVVFLLILSSVVSPFTGAQTPVDDQWLSFMEWNPGEFRLPEDEDMGLLADRRSPDPSWSGALTICDLVISAINRGDVPANQMHPAVRVLLSLEFENALKDGGRELEPRYGLPIREGDRVTVPVRLSGGEATGTGFIYLSRWENLWYIDQWAVDLIPFR